VDLVGAVGVLSAHFDQSSLNCFAGTCLPRDDSTLDRRTAAWAAGCDVVVAVVRHVAFAAVVRAPWLHHEVADPRALPATALAERTTSLRLSAGVSARVGW
jgi:hypothetical protein